MTNETDGTSYNKTANVIESCTARNRARVYGNDYAAYPTRMVRLTSYILPDPADVAGHGAKSSADKQEKVVAASSTFEEYLSFAGVQAPAPIGYQMAETYCTLAEPAINYTCARQWEQVAGDSPYPIAQAGRVNKSAPPWSTRMRIANLSSGGPIPDQYLALLDDYD